MKSLSYRVLGRSLALVLAAICGGGCSAGDDDVAVASDELKLEGRDIPTSLTQLRAGQPFIPALDESLLEVGSPCVPGAGVVINGGQVSSTAAVVQNRHTLSRELGFEISGTIPVAGGITGAASLTTKTTFDRQSAVVLFQTTGTYKSTLSSVSDDLPEFAASDISRCGYGYVTEAMHRVTAALVVSVRSTDEGKEVHGSAGAGKTGVADAKATLNTIISKGNVEISVRFATDVIPNLANAPIGDSVLIVGGDEGAKAAALDKLNRALDWLGQAHADIQNYLNELQKNSADAPAAPTQSVRFRFYPSTPESVRKALQGAAVNALSTRTNLGETNALIEGWERFGREVEEGRGFDWNTPNAPAGTVAELDAKKRDLLEDRGGKLTTYRDTLDDALEKCVEALRNDAKNEFGIGLAISRSCAAPPVLPVDRRMTEVRQISAVSADETQNDSNTCPSGYRLPREAESKIFGPWSRALRPSEKGIWIGDSGCNFSSGWIYDGNPGCTPFASSKTGVAVCVSKEKGPTPDE